MTDTDRFKSAMMVYVIMFVVSFTYAQTISEFLEIGFWDAFNLNGRVLIGLTMLLSLSIFLFESPVIIVWATPFCICMTLIGIWNGFYLATQKYLAFLYPSYVHWLGSYVTLGILLVLCAGSYYYLYRRYFG